MLSVWSIGLLLLRLLWRRRIPVRHLLAWSYRRSTLHVLLSRGAGHGSRSVGGDLRCRAGHRLAPTRWRRCAEDVGEGGITLG